MSEAAVSGSNTRVRGETHAPSKNRESNIELFRIITMLLIVAHHFVVNSGLVAAGGPIYEDPMSWRSLFLLIFGAWGKTGINCFVMISGYFMCKSHISARKFAKLLCEVMFYRLAINLAFCVSGYQTYSVMDWVLLLIPIKKISNGFTPAFLMFFLCIPFLNILVKNLTEKQHVYLLLLCGFLYVFLGTIPVVFSVTMNYVSWFCVVFFIAAYIRLYPKKIYDDTKFWGWTTLALLALDILSIFACAWLSKKIGKQAAYAFMQDSNSFLPVATGVSAFLFFKNRRVPYSRFINTVAASTFGVLLIHANSDTMRQWLWKDVLDVVGHYSSALMPLYVIGSVLLIFAACVGIDQLRMRMVEKPFFKYWDKYWDSVCERYKAFENRIALKLGIQG